MGGGDGGRRATSDGSLRNFPLPHPSMQTPSTRHLFSKTVPSTHLEVVLVDGRVQVALVLQRLHCLPHLHQAVPPAAARQHLRGPRAGAGGGRGGGLLTRPGAAHPRTLAQQNSSPPLLPLRPSPFLPPAPTSSTLMPASPCASGALKKPMTSACTAVSPPWGLYPPAAPPAGRDREAGGKGRGGSVEVGGREGRRSADAAMRLGSPAQPSPPGALPAHLPLAGRSRRRARRSRPPAPASCRRRRGRPL